MVAGLPEGLILNARTGLISGTPTQFGTGTVQLVALDSSVPANKATASLPIAVVANLQITTPSLKKATVGGTYKQQLVATGGLAPYTWSITAGTLPDGLMLNTSTGLITGAPTTAAETMLTFQVADAEKVPATLTTSFTLKVMPKIAVAALEITQAIQQYQLIDDFDSLVTANGGEPLVPLVVGKPAVARFYLTAVKDATTVTLKVDGVVTETKTLKATPNCQPEDARAHTNNCPSLDFYFKPSARFTLTYELDDDQGNMLDQNGFGLSARTTATVNLRGINFCTTGNISACTSGTNLIGTTGLTQSLWPTASVSPQEAPITLRQRVDAAPADSDALSLFIEGVLDKVNALYSPSDKAADAKNVTDTSYVAYYPGVLGKGDAVGSLPGFGIVLADPAVEPDPNALPHEFGHNLNEHHTDTALPAGDPGCYANAPDSGTPYPFANNELQSSQGLEYGSDVVRQRLVNPVTNLDIMGYCTPDWVGPFDTREPSSSFMLPLHRIVSASRRIPSSSRSALL